MDKRFKGQREKRSKPDLSFEVTEPGGLLDFLLLNLTNKSRNNVKSLLTHRAVSVDGAVITQFDTALSIGQRVDINSSDIKVDKQKALPDIIYEDSDIIVINKPAGLLTIASDKEKELTAYRLLTERVKSKSSENRIFIVHRLDRDTSGVLLFAKKEKVKIALQDNWSDLVTQRAYYAVVEGRLKEKSGSIQSWLKETKTLLVYSSPKAGDGLEAITDYKVLKESKGYTLVDIRLKTGRKNQIRVHMQDIGHSVAGDKKYGSKADPLKRLGLHAYKLEFKHPFSDKIMSFETDIPESFSSFFAK